MLNLTTTIHTPPPCWEKLPPELWHHIFQYCDLPTKLILVSVCKKFYSILYPGNLKYRVDITHSPNLLLKIYNVFYAYIYGPSVSLKIKDTYCIYSTSHLFKAIALSYQHNQYYLNRLHENRYNYWIRNQRNQLRRQMLTWPSASNPPARDIDMLLTLFTGLPERSPPYPKTAQLTTILKTAADTNDSRAIFKTYRDMLDYLIAPPVAELSQLYHQLHHKPRTPLLRVIIAILALYGFVALIIWSNFHYGVEGTAITIGVSLLCIPLILGSMMPPTASPKIEVTLLKIHRQYGEGLFKYVLSSLPTTEMEKYFLKIIAKIEPRKFYASHLTL